MRTWSGWIAAAVVVFALGHCAGRSAATRDAAPAAESAAALLFGVSADVAPRPKAGSNATAPLPDGTFEEDFAELTRRADAGDAAAARELALRYWQCRGVPETAEPAQAEAAGVGRATQGAQDGARAAPTPDDGAVESLQLGRALGMLHYCGATPRDVDRRRGLDALRRAAELGDADARLVYWSEAFDEAVMADAEALVERKRLASGFLRDALRSGDWRALAAVADVVERGHFARPDAQTAYAYWYATKLAPGASDNSLPWLAPSELLAAPDARSFAERRIAYLAPNLTPAQIAAAERRGRELLAECCRG